MSARLLAIFLIAWGIAAHATGHCTKADWQQLRQRQLFESCRDTRGAAAQRACEARYGELIAANYRSKRT